MYTSTALNVVRSCLSYDRIPSYRIQPHIVIYHSYTVRRTVYVVCCKEAICTLCAKYSMYVVHCTLYVVRRTLCIVRNAHFKASLPCVQSRPYSPINQQSWSTIQLITMADGTFEGVRGVWPHHCGNHIV